MPNQDPNGEAIKPSRMLHTFEKGVGKVERIVKQVREHQRDVSSHEPFAPYNIYRRKRNTDGKPKEKL